MRNTWIRLVVSLTLVLSLSGLAMAHRDVVGLELSAYFNNDGISYEDDPLDGDLNFAWQSLPAEQLPESGEVVHFQNIWFLFPSKEDGRLNNVAAFNQRIHVPHDNYHDIFLLATATNGPQSETALLEYTDGSVQEVALAVSAGSSRPSNAEHVLLSTDYLHGSVGRIEGATNLFVVTIPVDSERILRSVVLPENPNIHIFSLTLGLSPDLVVAEEVERWNLFAWSDAVGDDKGPGSYVYPGHEVFKPGTFDIAGVSLLESEDDYLVQVEIAGPVENPWGAPHGFSVHLLHVYLDTGQDAGTVESVPGANVTFAQPWDRAVVADGGWGSEIADFLASQVPNLAGQIYLSKAAWVEGQTINISVPKAFLGEYSSDWGIQVFMLGHESDSGSMAGAHVRRVVVDTGADWRFGGGDNDPAAPNVIDMLTPIGQDQYELLSGYKESGEMSVVPLIYPSR